MGTLPEPMGDEEFPPRRKASGGDTPSADAASVHTSDPFTPGLERDHTTLPSPGASTAIDQHHPNFPASGGQPMQPRGAEGLDDPSSFFPAR